MECGTRTTTTKQRGPGKPEDQGGEPARETLIAQHLSPTARDASGLGLSLVERTLQPRLEPDRVAAICNPSGGVGGRWPCHFCPGRLRKRRDVGVGHQRFGQAVLSAKGLSDGRENYHLRIRAPERSEPEEGPNAARQQVAQETRKHNVRRKALLGV